jgi:hypothetical protein
MSGSLARHNWLQNKLYHHPEILGTDMYNIRSKSREFGLVYDGHLLTVPDIFFRTWNGPNEMYEVKSSGNDMLFSKGMSQLEKMALWHYKNGFAESKMRLIMPTSAKYDIWLDMLNELEVYELGDTYKRGNVIRIK